jgi:hypothetical protein
MPTLLAVILAAAVGFFAGLEQTSQPAETRSDVHVHCEDGFYRLDGKPGDAVRVIDEQGNWLTCSR